MSPANNVLWNITIDLQILDHSIILIK